MQFNQGHPQPPLLPLLDLERIPQAHVDPLLNFRELGADFVECELPRFEETREIAGFGEGLAGAKVPGEGDEIEGFFGPAMGGHHKEAAGVCEGGGVERRVGHERGFGGVGEGLAEGWFAEGLVGGVGEGCEGLGGVGAGGVLVVGAGDVGGGKLVGKGVYLIAVKTRHVFVGVRIHVIDSGSLVWLDILQTELRSHH